MMSAFQPFAKHDPEADAIYVQMSDAAVAKSRNLDDLRIVDYAKDGQVAGVEFLGVGGGVDLRDVPNSDVVGKAIGDLGLDIKILV